MSRWIRSSGRILSGCMIGVSLVFMTVSCGETPRKKQQTLPEDKLRKKAVSGGEKKQTAVSSRQNRQKKKKTVFKDHVSGSLKVRFSAVSEETEKVQVKADFSNVRILNPGEEFTGKDPKRISAKERRLLESLRTARGADTLASGIASSRQGKKFFWSPAMQEGTARRSRIACCELSPDSSVIVFAETLGEDRGPFGSRIVYLDTHSWTILHVEHLLNYYIREMSFFPDGSILFTCQGQQSLRTADMAVHFDPVRSRVLGEYKRPGLRKGWASPDGKEFFATYRKESSAGNRIECYSLADPEGKDALFTVQGENSSPQLVFSPDGKTLYACGDKTLESYGVQNLKKLGKTALPEGFVCGDLLVNPDGSLIAAPEESLRQKPVWIRDGLCRPFGELSGGYLFPVPEFSGKVFGVLLSKKGRVGFFAFPALEEVRSIIPEECRERTNGKPWKIFSVKHRKDLLAVLDLPGNFYLLYRGKAERKYRKEILISSPYRERK